MLKAALLYLLLIFTMGTMGVEGRAALSQLVNLHVVSGEFIYLDGIKDVAIRAKGRDQFGNSYLIRCRWFRGLPVAVCVSGAVEEL